MSENNSEPEAFSTSEQTPHALQTSLIPRDTELGASNKDALVIRRIADLALRCRYLAQNYGVKEPIVIAAIERETDKSLYGKLRFKIENGATVPDIILIPFLEAHSDNYPDYTHDVSFRADDNGADPKGEMSLGRTSHIDVSSDYPSIGRSQLESIVLESYVLPFKEKNALYASVLANFDPLSADRKSRIPPWRRQFYFSFNNGPYKKLEKTSDLMGENPEDSPDYYDTAKGILDLVDSIISATESAIKKSDDK